MAADPDAVLADLYRRTSVAQALGDALATLARDIDVPRDALIETLDAFDQAMARNIIFAKEQGGAVNMEAELDVYNNIEEKWRLFVKTADVYIKSGTTEPDAALKVPELCITAVDVDMEQGHRRPPLPRLMPPGIFVAATRQHVGKTTSSLALMSGLVRRLGPERVGYIKPVGQQHEIVQGQKIDKDAKLMKEYFGLKCEYKDMSPVVMPKGYTRAFLDGQITEEQQIERIKNCYANIAANADVVVLEGSGHVGVGSIACLNNARVASLLGAELVLVANGGLGSAFDELDLNRAMCKEYGVQLRGVIVNKVMHDKMDMIKEYFAKALKRWDVPLLGVVPDEPFLSRPTIRDIEKLLSGRMLAATEQCRDRHYDIKDILLGMHDVNRFLAALEAATEKNPRPLVVTHVSRSDIILAFAAHAKKLERTGKLFEGALILGGLEDETLTPYIQEYVSHYRVPVMHALAPTAAALNKIQAYVSKLNIDDKARVRAAISHYEPHIDFDALRIGQKHH